MDFLARACVIHLERIAGHRMDAIPTYRDASRVFHYERMRSSRIVQGFKFNAVHGGIGVLRNPESVGRIALQCIDRTCHPGNECRFCIARLLT